MLFLSLFCDTAAGAAPLHVALTGKHSLTNRRTVAGGNEATDFSQPLNDLHLHLGRQPADKSAGCHDGCGDGWFCSGGLGGLWWVASAVQFGQ